MPRRGVIDVQISRAGDAQQQPMKQSHEQLHVLDGFEFLSFRNRDAVGGVVTPLPSSVLVRPDVNFDPPCKLPRAFARRRSVDTPTNRLGL